MKKSWRDRLEALKSKGSGAGDGLRTVTEAIRQTRFENPVRSVGMKLFLLIFCGILACVLSLGWFSYSQSRTIIQNKVADSGSETASQTAARIDLLLRNYEMKTMEFIANSDFTGLLSLALSSNSDDYTRFDSQRQVNEMLNTVILSDKNITGIYVVPQEESAQTFGASVMSSLPDTATVLAMPTTSQIVEAGGKVVWIPTMKQGLSGKGTTPTIAVGRQISGVASKPVLLILELNLSVIREIVDGLNFGEDSTTRLMTADRTIVYSRDEAELAAAYGEQLPGEEGAQVTENGTAMLSVGGQVPANGWVLVANIPVSELVRDAGVIRNLTVIMSVVSILIAAAIGLLVMWTVARPLAQMRNLMNEGEKGNLTVRSNIRKKDEIGQLSDSFNRMMEQITGLVRQTNHSAGEVLETASALTDASRKTATSAKEIAVATEEIASGATNLAMESERGSEMTNQIGVQVQSVIQSNVEMGNAAAEVQEAGRKGTEYMAGLIEKTGQTEEMTRSMVEKVDKLKESTRSIRKILDVLGNVSKQTNILSLNATIEAARAGAAGKGFMVVADEIRKLADQSRQSIGVVGEIVETIQREIDETVSVLSDAYPLFQAQIESVREANQIFTDVQAHMEGFVGRLESATESVSQLEGAQSTLSLAMTNVSAVAQQSSATSEEVASLSNEQLNISEGLVQLSNRLEAVSVQLRESLSKFTVN